MAIEKLEKYGARPSTPSPSPGVSGNPKVDSRLYFTVKPYGTLTLAIFVAEMGLASSFRRLMEETKELLSNAFKVKLLGSLRCFIWWELLKTPYGIHVNQTKFLEKFAASLDLSHVKPQPPRMATTADFSALHDSAITLIASDHSRYRSIVGGVMYAAVCTRPDIAFGASVLARQMHAPTGRHLVLAKRLVGYLLCTK